MEMPAADRANRARVPLPVNVRFLGWVSLVNDIASEIIYPLLPQFLLTSLKGDKFILGGIEAISESTSSLLKLYFGAVSDRLGRRKSLVVAGYGLTALARPFIAWVGTPSELLGLRVADRVGKSMRTAPRDALLADSTPVDQRGRAFGFHRAMDHLGATIGPLLAALFLWFYPAELRLLFMLTIIPGLVLMAMVIWGIHEPEAQEKKVSAPQGKSVISDRRFVGYLLALSLFTLGNASDMFLLVRLGELGVSAPFIPLVWGAFHIAKSAGNFWLGPWADRLGAKPMIVGGWGIYAAVYLGFAAANSASAGVLLFLAYAVFYALTEPAEKKLVADLVSPEQRGSAFGWFNASMGIMAFPASLLFGWLYENGGAWASFGVSAGLAFVAALVLLSLRLPIPTSPSSRD